MSLLLLFLLLFATPEPTASSLLQSGLTALNRGQVAQAQQSLEQASRLEPGNAYVWSALAEAYRRSHDQYRAATAAQKAEQTGGKLPVIEHALAMYYSEAGNVRKAAELESRYAEDAKAQPGAWNRAAHWYLQAGDEAHALPLAQKAAGQDAGVAFEWAEYLLHEQQFTEAADLVSAGLASHERDPQLLLTLGVARYGQRRFEDAIVQFLQVIQIDGTIQQPYLFLGRLLDQAGAHLPEIVADCERWAHDNPDNAKAQLTLAKALLAADPRSSRSEELLGRSIQLADSDWEAHYELGTLLATNHQYAPAAMELKRAIQLDGKQPQPHYQLARVYDRLGDSDQARNERSIHEQLTGVAKPQ